MSSNAFEIWPGCERFINQVVVSNNSNNKPNEGDDIDIQAPKRAPPPKRSSVSKSEAEKRVEIWNNCDGVVFDCDGVIWRGDKPMKGAKQLVDWLQNQNKKVFFCSNNSTKNRDKYVEKLGGMGIQVKKENILTSAFAVAVYLASIGKAKFDKETQKVLIIGCHGLYPELDDYGIQYIKCEEVVGDKHLTEEELIALAPPSENIGAIVVSVDQQLTYSRAAYMVNALRWFNDALFICSNQDPSYPTASEHLLLPGSGSVVNYIAAASQRIATDVGKPSRVMWDIIRHRTSGLEADKFIMIGDRDTTDIAFANACGMKSILLLSGVTSLETALKIDDPKLQPTYLAPSIHHLHPEQ